MARGGFAALTGLAALGGLAFSLAAPAQFEGPPPAKGKPIAQRYAGINIATGGFNEKAIPGRYGYDYMYPTAAEAAPFLAGGMNAVRVPFLWERIQPAPGAPFDPAEIARLDAALGVLKGFRLIVLDVHNYGYYRGVRLDQPARAGALADLWTRLAKRYQGNSRIAFGIMNEPHDIPAKAWAALAGESLRAIRATGAKNLVLVPGTLWSGAHSWMVGGGGSNGAALAPIRDPANNMAFEFHQYLDSNSSGTNTDCVSPMEAEGRMADATRWLRQTRARGFLGEFGAPPGDPCLAALDALLGAVDAADDVWLGWTYWAAGGWWGAGYPMSVQPDAKGPRPQFAVLRRHLPK